jgi:catechol 2,3-dioxygenase-like lactoylglutathione lyase family enzyme
MLKESKAFSSFSVRDLNQSRTFYRDTLGLEITEPMGQLALQIKGGIHLFIYAKSDHVPATFTVLNFPVDNVEETMSALRERGVKFEIYQDEEYGTDENGLRSDDGMKIAWFKDPSGNILSIIEENGEGMN